MGLGHCDREAVDACLRVQVEEDVAELLTWPAGTYEFDEDAMVRALVTDKILPTRISLDGHGLFLDMIARARECTSRSAIADSGRFSSIVPL